MKISANILDEEFDFEFMVPNDSSPRWTGIPFGKGNVSDCTISFIENDSLLTELNIDQRITTPKEIIVERLLEMIKAYNDKRQMGFEGESGSTKIVLISKPGDIKPYDPEQIRVRPLVLSAFQVHRDINKKKIDLNPDFQRNFVWDDTRKSRLIESMLLKIPLPAFYFAEDNKGNFQVVDGLQRLTVINQFLNNEFKLKNLEYLHNLEGKFYAVDEHKSVKANEVLFEPYDSRVETTQLNINVIEASSPLKVKYDIFFRINTGGRPLNNQEIRNCFATTRMRSLLKRMAAADDFVKATGRSVSDTRMDAQELALRFFSFFFFREKYVGEMNSFLDESLEILADYNDNELLEAEERYYIALKSAYHLFGDYSFRKCLPDHLLPGKKRQLINKAMFVVLMVLLAKTDPGQVKEKPYAQLVKFLAAELQQNKDLYDALTTGTSDRNKIDFIFDEFERIIVDYLNH